MQIQIPFTTQLPGTARAVWSLDSFTVPRVNADWPNLRDILTANAARELNAEIDRVFSDSE